MFAKCIRQNFLISILPSDLLICLEGKTLADQHSESTFYPHRSADQHFTPALQLAAVQLAYRCMPPQLRVGALLSRIALTMMRKCL